MTAQQCAGSPLRQAARVSRNGAYARATSWRPGTRPSRDISQPWLRPRGPLSGGAWSPRLFTSSTRRRSSIARPLRARVPAATAGSRDVPLRSCPPSVVRGHRQPTERLSDVDVTPPTMCAQFFINPAVTSGRGTQAPGIGRWSPCKETASPGVGWPRGRRTCARACTRVWRTTRAAPEAAPLSGHGGRSFRRAPESSRQSEVGRRSIARSEQRG